MACNAGLNPLSMIPMGCAAAWGVMQPGVRHLCDVQHGVDISALSGRHAAAFSFSTIMLISSVVSR